MKIIPEIRDNRPIPNPFPMPKFPTALDLDLTNKMQTAKVIRNVAKHVASAMFTYQSDVSKQERERVSREVIEKYPHLSSSNKACPYVSLQCARVKAQY